jgi:siroheme synthase
MDTNEPLIQIASRPGNKLSRRGILSTGVVAGIATAFAVPAVAQMAATPKGKSQTAQDKKMILLS